MDETPTKNEASFALNDLGFKLETIVPSEIKKPNSDRARGNLASAASTLRGLQNRTTFKVESQSLSNGWTRVKHPDWGVFYVHAEKAVCTLSNVLDPKTRSSIDDAAERLQASDAWRGVLEDHKEGLNLVLDARDKRTTYYCVSHAERRVFWLEGFGHEEVEIPCPSSKCRGVETSRGHCIEGQYWKHCELFPTSFTVTKVVTGELKDALLQAAADRLLVKFSTSPFGKNDLEYMLNLVKEIDADIRKGNGHGAWIIARFMALYNDGVLSSSYGQPDDYFDIDDTGKIPPFKRPFLLAILGPFFLMSPDVYAEELHSFHENFTLARWSSFVNKVDQSIRDSNLLATVLLSTNVGTLAWSDGGRVGGLNTPTTSQIVTYISIICSVGSIIIGLAIYKQYRAKGADTPLRAVVVLRRILKKPLGLESLAIICSLPYVLLMWSLIAFLGAFGVIFYEKTGIRVRVPVTVALFLVVLGLCFCMYAAAGREEQKAQSSGQQPASLSKV